jgi:hypothetical protein
MPIEEPRRRFEEGRRVVHQQTAQSHNRQNAAEIPDGLACYRAFPGSAPVAGSRRGTAAEGSPRSAEIPASRYSRIGACRGRRWAVAAKTQTRPHVMLTTQGDPLHRS